MDVYYQRKLDVEQRSDIHPGDMGQLVFSIWTFICALLIKTKYPHNSEEFSLWVEIMFYASLIWIAFLLLSIVGRYKDRTIRGFFKIITMLFFVFHIAMWGWLIHLYVVNKEENHFIDANRAGDMFAELYLMFGALLALIALIGIIAWIFSRFSKTSNFEDRILDNLGEDDEEFHIYS